MKTIFVHQIRKDAIGLVDQEIISRLKNATCDVFALHKKGTIFLSIVVNYLYNILILISKTYHYQQVYFSRENPYVIFVRLFYRKKKIIMCVHHVEDYRGKSRIGRLMFKSVDQYVAISEFTKSQLIDLGVKVEKIFVNYQGIKNDFYPEPVDDFQTFPYILYVGTELERKNIPALLQTLQILVRTYPALKLIKIGKSASEHREQQTNNLIDELGLTDNVMLMRNFVSNGDLRRYYSNAICYVSLATLEGFGMTVPEAMACGCPVVVSNIPPFREIVGDSQIIVDPYDIAEITQGIERYIVDTDFADQARKQGLQQVQQFGRDENVKRLLTLLNLHHENTSY